MERVLLHGDLSDNHFSRLLFRIWKSQKTGRLEIKNRISSKKLEFKKGNIIITKAQFDENVFLQKLSEKKILTPSLKKYEKLRKTNSSMIKSLIELNLLSPSYLWKLMEVYIKSEFYPLFDWTQGEYYFDPEYSPDECQILFYIHTLEYILEGIRQMQNNDLIKAYLPPDKEDIQILSPGHTNQINLAPHEKYLLNITEKQKNLKRIYELSELGAKENQKVIYSFLILELAGFPETKTNIQHSPEFSQVELINILKTFNKKCSFIFKYISKKIGPVALNVIEKCMEDTKANLSPLFQNVRIEIDGRIETNSILKASLALSPEDCRENMLRDLNEILAAEVLVVKRTLGNEHESILVKSLEKIS